MRRKSVLVTGSAGAIGRQVVAELRRAGHRVRGLDRQPTPGLEDAVLGTIQEPERIGAAMEGVEVVVHLAATPDEADFLTELVPNNIVGLYHVFDQARRRRIQRLIVASSSQVIWGNVTDGDRFPLPPEVPYAPMTHYATTKVFAEALGRLYADHYGMQVLIVRPGWTPRSREHAVQLLRHPLGRDVYLSPRDAGRFFRCAVEAESLPSFAVLYATSETPRTILDLRPAWELIGYRPADRFPEGMPVSPDEVDE